jgi:PAS domain-containing protein
MLILPIVIGVNPRRPFDEDYQSFVSLLNIQLATSLASTTLLETEIRRGLTEAEAAAIERARLSAELATQKNRMQHIAEVRSNCQPILHRRNPHILLVVKDDFYDTGIHLSGSNSFTYRCSMLEYLPGLTDFVQNSRVGMFSIDPVGLLLEGNESWFQMTGHSRDKIFAMSWIETVHDDCMAEALRGWKLLTENHKVWSAELVRIFRKLSTATANPLNYLASQKTCCR